GGTITANGTPKQLRQRPASLTGRYLAEKESVPIPITRRIPSNTETDAAARADQTWLELSGCRHHNLRNIDVRIPLGVMTCVTGVSGSGKSPLIEGTLSRAVARRLNQSSEQPGPFAAIQGTEHLSKVIAVDQQPLGNTPASNPATYTGLFDTIRELFARLPAAKVRGYNAG